MTNEEKLELLQEKINKNTFIDNIKVFAGNDESFVGGTLKVEIFKDVNGVLYKTHEKSFVTSVGVNILELEFFLDIRPGVGLLDHMITFF